MEKICAHCDAKYILSYSRLNWRDKDTIECEICGKTLHSWNEAKMWEAKLISKPTEGKNNE